MSDDGSLDKLRSRLYSRIPRGLGAQKRRALREGDYEVPEKWEETPPPPPRRKISGLSILLGVSAVFFVGAIIVAGYYFYRGVNIVSGDNIRIEVQGPASIGGGEELTLQLVIANQNTIPLISADIIIEYPPDTRSSTNLEEDLPRYRESLGEIAPGEVVQRSVKSVLFGPEGERKSIRVGVEYRVPSSNAVYYKEQIFDLSLSSSALSLQVDAYKELTSGQEIEFTLTVTSNAATAVDDVLLVGQYPFGFQFVSASPAPLAGNNQVWNLGSLKSEEKRTIRIRGTLTGENDDERVFRFSTGIQSAEDTEALKAAFASALHTVRIAKSFIGVDLALDGNRSPEHVIEPGKRVRADITWSNNLPDRVVDGEILVTLAGDVLDERTVEAPSGFYRSADNTIIWSSETLSSLRQIPPGGSGTVSFSFAPHTLASGADLRGGNIALEVSIRGNRISESGVPEEVRSTQTRAVKLSSNLALASRVLHNDGPIENTGPLPPQAEEETTYTVVLTVSNSLNMLENARVTATLPSYVRFTGAVSPSGESLTYSEVGGVVEWRVGTLPQSASPRIREVAFQVAIAPSISQVGTAPVLVNQQRVTALDTFTNTELSATRGALTTRLSDSGQNGQYDKVAP